MLRCSKTPTIGFGPYAKLLAPREMRYLYGASVIGRLPIGMCGLAILLLVQSASASFAVGGAATGCYVAGLAVAAPVMGRVIDRRGPRRMLAMCALLFPLSLLALVHAVASAQPRVLVLALAILCGAGFPPITVCMRTLLRQGFADDATLSTGYSLDSVLIEVMFIAGPMLVALFVAVASPAAAVGFAAACGFLGVILFLRAPALRLWQIQMQSATSVLGPLAGRSFLALLAIVVCYAIAFGLTEIGVAAYAAQSGRPALAGVFLGVMSATSAFGGLAYGSRTWRRPLPQQFGITLAAMGLGLAPLAAPWAPAAFGFFCAVGGLVMAPALIIQSMLVAKAARSAQMTEAFTWATSALLVGVGLGMALGGVLVERWTSAAAFYAAAAAALFAAFAAHLRSRG